MAGMDIDDIFKAFAQQETLSPKSISEYKKQYKTISKKINIFDDESTIIDFLDKIENPNTKSNKAFIILKLRRALDYPYSKLETMREQLKDDIAIRRKMKSREYIKTLISYTELREELDKLQGTGLPYIFNYMHVMHGLRNRDLNAVIKYKKPKEITENTIVFNPKQRKKELNFYIVDYKTAKTHGMKHITITDKNLLNEMKKLNKQDGGFLIPVKKSGQKSSDGYVNVLASQYSIHGLGEAKIAKILMRHYIDSKRFDQVHKLSEQRGTNLVTLYTSYNMYDNIHKQGLQHKAVQKAVLKHKAA